MSNPKASKASKASSAAKASNQPAADPGAAAIDSAGDIESSPTTQTAEKKAFLERVSRFLVNIQSKQYSARAARQGYNASHHAEGWKLWSKAAGMDRPLDHWFSEQAQVVNVGEGAGDRLRVLQEIDTFENLWFPRVRAIIRRKVARERRDAFAEAFFKNLAQQPLGPSVVGSVATLLQRIEGLEKSKEPGAGEVFETLQERGLTVNKIAGVRGLLKEAEEGSGKAPKKHVVSAEELAVAQAAQEEAFEDLKDWFNDWATTLRSVFGAREQLVLALTQRGGRRAAAEEVDETEEVGEADDSEAVDDSEDASAEPAPVGAKKAATKPGDK